MNINVTNNELKEVSALELEATDGGWLQTVSGIAGLISFADQLTGGEILKQVSLMDELKKRGLM